MPPRPGRAAAPGLVYVPDLAACGETVLLSAAESHYVARVCRARAGDALEATDGLGRLALLRVASTGPRVGASVERVRSVPRPGHAWALCGAPEGQRAAWLVEKLAELGVARLTPLECSRGRWGGWGRTGPRLERVAIAAMRQSRSPHRIEIDPPAMIAPALAGLPPGSERWIANEGGESATPGGDRPVIGAVGPASGFTAAEQEEFQAAGFRPLRLAAGRLRAETAAVAWASLWAASRRPGPEP